MISTAQTCQKMKRTRVALLVGVVFVVLTAAVYVFGLGFEFEYPFWPTLWLAEQTKTPDGSRMTDLIRIRSGSSYVKQHWHHCTFCDDVYPYAPHMAVTVTVNNDERNFYLFDWDVMQRRLLPITVRTAKVFPELIPVGYVVKPLRVGSIPQIYHDDEKDEPCLIVAQSSK
jgi:hypothetical protein